MAPGKPARVSDEPHGPSAAVDGGRLDIHASALAIGEHGILIRGPSGSGKTRLALALAAEASRDAFARLVADDRTLLSRHAGRIVARPHPAIAGLVERRGLGIVTVPSEPACRVSLVVDLCRNMAPTPAGAARWLDHSGRRRAAASCRRVAKHDPRRRCIDFDQACNVNDEFMTGPVFFLPSSSRCTRLRRTAEVEQAMSRRRYER